MKIIITIASHKIIGEYMSDVIPRKGELIVFDGLRYRSFDVVHNVKTNTRTTESTCNDIIVFVDEV